MDTLEANSFFTKQLQVAHQRTDALCKTLKAGSQPESNQLLMDFLEELHVALEELEVAQEELCHQHAKLLATQRSLENERQRYRDLFEFAPDGYLVTDLFGTVREANQAIATLLKIRVDRLMGKPITNFVLEENRRAFRTILNELPMLNRIQEWEVKLRNREEAILDVAITVETVRDDREKVVSLRWIIRDITDRKNAEEHLRQVQLQNLQLIETDRLRREFIATLTHELRTPMNAIMGFSELLLRQFRTQGETREATMLERIYRNGKHLLLLIEDMLDFAKLEANRLQLNLREVDLCYLLGTTVEELRPLAEQKNLELRLTTTGTQLLMLNDPLRLRQIVINLLSNAIKFTEVGYVALNVLELPEGRIAIVVRDTGIGIDPIDQRLIFQEFWQVNQTNTRSQGGTGLGLSITKALIELMQGSISVESEVGVGTTFRVELPRQIALS